MKYSGWLLTLLVSIFSLSATAALPGHCPRSLEGASATFSFTTYTEALSIYKNLDLKTGTAQALERIKSQPANTIEEVAAFFDAQNTGYSFVQDLDDLKDIEFRIKPINFTRNIGGMLVRWVTLQRQKYVVIVPEAAPQTAEQLVRFAWQMATTLQKVRFSHQFLNWTQDRPSTLPTHIWTYPQTEEAATAAKLIADTDIDLESPEAADQALEMIAGLIINFTDRAVRGPSRYMEQMLKALEMSEKNLYALLAVARKIQPLFTMLPQRDPSENIRIRDLWKLFSPLSSHSLNETDARYRDQLAQSLKPRFANRFRLHWYLDNFMRAVCIYFVTTGIIHNVDLFYNFSAHAEPISAWVQDTLLKDEPSSKVVTEKLLAPSSLSDP